MKISNIPLEFILNSNKGFILVGHGVDDRKRDSFVEELHQNLAEVKAFLLKMRELGFKFISMEELLLLSKKKFRADFPWIHLSFDDGYLNNYTRVLPMAKDLNIPFSVFIPTNHIANQHPLYTFKIRIAILNLSQSIDLLGISFNKKMQRQEKIMAYRKFSVRFKTLGPSAVFELMKKIDAIFTPEEWNRLYEVYPSDKLLDIKTLKVLHQDPLVYLGAHANHHVLLNNKVNFNDLKEEIIQPMVYFQENLGFKTVAFAYPNGKTGDFTHTSEKILRSSGYELGFTAIKGLVGEKTNPFCIPRISLPSKLDNGFFAKLLSIPYERMGKIKFALKNNVFHRKSAS